MTEKQYRIFATAQLDSLSTEELIAINEALDEVEKLPLTARIVFGRIFACRIEMLDNPASEARE